VLDELQGRVDALDAHLDAVAVATTLDDLLAHGHGALRRERTDPLIGLVGAQLVELVAGPVLGTAGRDAHPSGHRRRDGRRHECEACFDEGYALGRILLDTHDLTLVHSPLSTLDGAELRAASHGPDAGDGTRRARPGAPAGVRPIDDARAAGFARLRALRRLVLREETSDAYLRTAQLAPFVRTRAARHEGAQPGAAVDRDLAAQLISLGLMSALCEWSMLLGDDTPSAEVLRLR